MKRRQPSRTKSKASPNARPKTVNEYLAALSKDKRAALQRVRKLIRAAAPKAQERISYGIPAFRLNGRWLIWFGSAANHCAVYGLSGVSAKDLEAFDTSGRGTIRFQPDHPLPAALVRKIIKARIARNTAKEKSKRGKRGSSRSRS